MGTGTQKHKWLFYRSILQLCARNTSKCTSFTENCIRRCSSLITKYGTTGISEVFFKTAFQLKFLGKYKHKYMLFWVLKQHLNNYKCKVSLQDISQCLHYNDLTWITSYSRGFSKHVKVSVIRSGQSGHLHSYLFMYLLFNIFIFLNFFIDLFYFIYWLILYWFISLYTLINWFMYFTLFDWFSLLDLYYCILFIDLFPFIDIYLIYCT